MANYPALEKAMGLQLSGELDKAAALYEGLARAEPDDFLTVHLLGAAKLNLGDLNAAVALLKRAVALNSINAAARCNLGLVYFHLGQHEAALTEYQVAMRLQPDLAGSWSNAALALSQMKRFEEAIPCCNRALELQPGWREMLETRAYAAAALGETDAPLADLEACAADGPLIAESEGLLIGLRQARASWENFPAQLRDEVAPGSPLTMLALCTDPAQQLRMARLCATHFTSAQPELLPRRCRSPGERVRIAYVSGDFRAHPMSRLITPLVAGHDRTRFEVFGVSLGPEDGSKERARIKAAFDVFLDARDMPDAAVTAWMRDREIDIAIDLMGYTRHCRPNIFAARAAPLQASFLGYPGTTGASWMDAIIGDQFVIPPGDEPFYAERVERLPHCYHPPNPVLEVGEAPTRQEVGLPAGAFVFASFANTWKINPEVFDVWTGLLRSMDDAVLWLVGDTDATITNLRREAERRGIDARRLVFAQRVGHGVHLARHKLADLCLDAWPYGGYTTTFEALLMSVPVVTWAGRTFVSRVAGSMLHALGVPELVAESPACYQTLALALARNAERLAALRVEIASKVKTSPLFDAERYRGDFEALLETMVQ